LNQGHLNVTGWRRLTKRRRRLQGPLRRRRGIRGQAQGSADDNQGEAVGGAEDCVLADPEADETHPWTTCQRDGTVDEGHTGTSSELLGNRYFVLFSTW